MLESYDLYKSIAHVVRARDLGSGPVAFVGYAFERTMHLPGMGLVNLVPEGHGKGTFPYYP
jgi:hypothetical protein